MQPSQPQDRATKRLYAGHAGSRRTDLMYARQRKSQLPKASVHIISNPTLLDHICPSPHPITVRGITRDITSVSLEGTLRSIGIKVYHSPGVAADILSYSRLKDTHTCTFCNDTFIAEPHDHGPTLTFKNRQGYYALQCSVWRSGARCLSSGWKARRVPHQLDEVHDIHLT